MSAPTGYRVIAVMSYEPKAPERGYTGETLYVNVGTGAIEARPVTDRMKEIFVGGRGFGLWRLWNAIDGKTKWNDPDNEIVISSGPSKRGYARDPQARATRWLSCNDWPGEGPPWAHEDELLAQECCTRLGSQPLLAGIKHLNRLEQVLASRELQSGRQEGVLCNQQGRPVEGIASNILLRFNDHYLTPPLRDAGVAGTVRQLVLDQRELLGLPLHVSDTEMASFYRAEGLFMMNALRGIQPVAKLGEHAYPLARRPNDLDRLHAACFTFSGEPVCAD